MATRETSERIGTAVRQLLGEVSQAELARRLDVDPSVVNRWVNGKAPFDHDDVANIENALGLTAGTIALVAGLYDPQAGESVPALIASDPSLDEEDRRLLLALYERSRRRVQPNHDGVTDHS